MTRLEQQHPPVHVTHRSRAGTCAAVTRSRRMPDHHRQAAGRPGGDVQKKAGFF